MTSPEGSGSDDLGRARERVRGARRVVVLTGAGVSAESGVPVFRGEGGLWRSHRPEELATPEAFARDPVLVWEWYQWRRERVGVCRPNPAHEALARAALEGVVGRIVTQNVDGLHEVAARELAGGRDPSPALPLELHGSLLRIRCVRCPHAGLRSEPVRTGSVEELPRCPDCDALLRPAVVWFGEALDEGVLVEAFREAAAADVCLVVGTSAVVQPAASLPLSTRRRGGFVIEVNPEPTPLTPVVDVTLRGPAGAVVPALLEP